MGRIVLITGASGGLGPHIVHAFVTRGDVVVAVGRDARRLRHVSGATHEVSADVTSESGADYAVAQAEQFGPLEAVVCAAGGWAGGTTDQTPLDLWEQMMSLNARTAFLMARAALRVMLPRGAGTLVLVASLAALEGDAGSAAYAASKAAVASLAQSIAAQGRGRGITCNAVLPGTIDTPRNRASMPTANPASWVRPEEVAQAIAFLASDEAAGVTGSLVLLPGH